MVRGFVGNVSLKTIVNSVALYRLPHIFRRSLEGQFRLHSQAFVYNERLFFLQHDQEFSPTGRVACEFCRSLLVTVATDDE